MSPLFPWVIRLLVVAVIAGAVNYWLHTQARDVIAVSNKYAVVAE